MKDNLQTVQGQRKEFERTIEEKNDSLIIHIITLKEKALTDISNTTIQKEKLTQKSLHMLSSKERNILKIISKKEAIKKYTLNYQTFIGVKVLGGFGLDCKSSLKELSDNEKLDNVKLILE